MEIAVIALLILYIVQTINVELVAKLPLIKRMSNLYGYWGSGRIEVCGNFCLHHIGYTFSLTPLLDNLYGGVFP